MHSSVGGPARCHRVLQWGRAQLPAHTLHGRGRLVAAFTPAGPHACQPDFAAPACACAPCLPWIPPACLSLAQLAVACSQHRWDAGGGPERAFYINAFAPGAVEERNERAEPLCQVSERQAQGGARGGKERPARSQLGRPSAPC